jgi:hypothetical protein
LGRKKIDAERLMLSTLTKQEEKLRMYYLSGRVKSDFFVKLYVLFGEQFPLFLTLFHGHTVKVPTLKYLKRLEAHCKIYSFLKRRRFTDKAFQKAAKKFKRKEDTLRRIVNRLTKVMVSFDVRKYLKHG